MIHWLAVGHFDPLDPMDHTARPYKPKVSRPIPRGVGERLLDEFGREIRSYLCYDEDGYIVCYWSEAPYLLWERVQEFARFLAARQEATVMDEMFMIQWPPKARQVQQSAWTTPPDLAPRSESNSGSDELEDANHDQIDP